MHDLDFFSCYDNLFLTKWYFYTKSHDYDCERIRSQICPLFFLALIIMLD